MSVEDGLPPHVDDDSPPQGEFTSVQNLVVVSDLHCGCRAGLCPEGPVRLDDGGTYSPSDLQVILWGLWKTFWYEWVPLACRHEPFAVLLNGDALDGVHHGTKTQVSQNFADQGRIAEEVLKPIVDLCQGRFYFVRGTESHSGKSAEMEEILARSLGAVPDASGQSSRFEIFLQVGKGLVHAMHHIGVTGSMHYESTAVMKELSESYTEAGRWGDNPPDVVVRSHRHRHLEVRVPTRLGYGITFVTPGWQLKTPFTYRVAGGRLSTPQIGGSLIRQGDKDLYTRHRVWRMPRPQIVQL